MLARLVVAIAAISSITATTQHWSVQDPGTTKYCIIVEADPVITVKFGDNATYTVNMNNTISATGNCTGIRNLNDTVQLLNVKFRPTDSGPATEATLWMLDLVFGKNESTGAAFQLIDYSLTTTETASMPGSKTKTFKMADAATNDVSARKGTDAYRCSSTVLGLEQESKVDMKNMHALAFAMNDDNKFSKEQVFENCMADAQTSDVVPIIVGACLAGLVVIVLVAYLIGRARAKRQGYASV